MANVKVSQLPAATAVADTDNFLASQGATSRRVPGSVLRGLWGLQATPWDATGVSGPAIPEYFLNTTAAVSSGANYDVTLVDDASPYRTAYSKPCPAPVSGQRWARFERIPYAVTDSVGAYGLMFTNENATLADLIASFQTFPTLVGSVEYILYQIVDHTDGTGLGILITPGGIEAFFPASGSVPVGTAVFMGVDYTTGDFVRDIGGTVTTITPSFPVAGVRVWFFAQDTSPSSVDAGTFPISFSATDGGKLGFEIIGDALPPVGAADGKRYLVENVGTYNGKALADGDVAEFYDTLNGVIVTPASIPTTDEIIVAIGPSLADAIEAVVTPVNVEAYLAAGRIVSVAQDVAGGADGDCYIVATAPFGNFAGFNPGAVAVRAGGVWYEVAKSDLIGRTFTFGAASGGAFNIRLYDAGGLFANSDDPYYTPVGAVYFGSETEQQLRAKGWVLIAVPGSGHIRRRVHNFSGSSSASISQGTAEYFDVTIDQDFTLFAGVSLQWPTTGYIRVTNADVASHNLYLGTGTYAIASGASAFFVMLGDSFASVQFTAPLVP